MHNWWQLISAVFLALLVIVGLNITLTTGFVRIAYNAIIRVAVMHSNWQTRDWLEIESPHFRLRYREKDAQLAPLVLKNAEEVYEPVNKFMQYKPAEKSLIIMHPDRESLARQFGWTASESAMGVYWNGVIRILSPGEWLGNRELEEIKTVFKETGPMVHEYTHLLVDKKTRGNCPRWLTEGIAQYMERQLIGFTLPCPEGSRWYSLAEIDYAFDRMPEQTAAYHQSLLVVDYIIQLWDWPSLNRLLDFMGRGNSLEKSFREVLNTVPADFEKSVRNAYYQ